MPLLKQCFSPDVQFKPLFEKSDSQEKHNASPDSSDQTSKGTVHPAINLQAYAPSAPHKQSPQSGKKIDISDTAAWPKATLLMRYFSGTITEIHEVTQ